jgi:hypothetical protein
MYEFYTKTLLQLRLWTLPKLRQCSEKNEHNRLCDMFRSPHATALYSTAVAGSLREPVICSELPSGQIRRRVTPSNVFLARFCLLRPASLTLTKTSSHVKMRAAILQQKPSAFC